MLAASQSSAPTGSGLEFGTNLEMQQEELGKGPHAGRYGDSKQHRNTQDSLFMRKVKKGRTYVLPIRSRECLCSEFSLAQQKRTKEGLGPVLAGQRGSAHRTDMKMSGFIRQGGRGDQAMAESGQSRRAGLRSKRCVPEGARAC